MNKRYQVFVSSTYADLQDERRKVIQALMEMDCIPAGMELFPAADDEQWEFIKRVIDDCDYYILIMGGRYGSLTPDGISYTEREFDYAVSKGLKVLAFVHGSPGDISLAKSELNSELRQKLALFRDKVCRDRLIKSWTAAAELPGLVALSLQKTIKVYPAVGWVRANTIATSEALGELNTIRKENADLQAKLAAISHEEVPDTGRLAALDEKYNLKLKFERRSSYGDWNSTWKAIEPTWEEIFCAIAPELQEFPSDDSVKTELARALAARAVEAEFKSARISEDDFKTIRVQLLALRLVKVQHLKTTSGGVGFFWSLTPKGERLMFELRSVKTEK